MDTNREFESQPAEITGGASSTPGLFSASASGTASILKWFVQKGVGH